MLAEIEADSDHCTSSQPVPPTPTYRSSFEDPEWEEISNSKFADPNTWHSDWERLCDAQSLVGRTVVDQPLLSISLIPLVPHSLCSFL